MQCIQSRRARLYKRIAYIIAPMKIAITGLVNAGKTTVFNALTGQAVETTLYATTSGEPNMGVVKVPDPRIDKLTEIFNPKKTANSTVHYVDYLGLTKGDMKQNRLVGEHLKDADALLHVVRAFEDDAVVHPLEKVDPINDINTIEIELLFGDIDLVERRIVGIAKAKKRGNQPENPDEEKALEKCKAALDAEKPLREVEFSEDEQKAMRHLQFMSIKPMIVALNIAEDDLGSDKTAALVKEAQAVFGDESSVTVTAMSGKVEMDIAELPADEAREFLDDLGIDEPALNKLIRVSYENVGLISFFTVGEDEVKAWSIKTDTDAVNAAGKIHSDIQRGFIRAEVVSYDDFITAGSLSKARDVGTLRLEGKTYLVKDGDIINFRFNV
jgi:GTP-binding protein YchF